MRNLNTECLQDTRGAKRNAWHTSVVIHFRTIIAKSLQLKFSNAKYCDETAVLDDVPGGFVSFDTILWAVYGHFPWKPHSFFAKTPNVFACSRTAAASSLPVSTQTNDIMIVGSTFRLQEHNTMTLHTNSVKTFSPPVLKAPTVPCGPVPSIVSNLLL